MRGILNAGPAMDPLRQMYMTEMLDMITYLGVLGVYYLDHKQ